MRDYALIYLNGHQHRIRGAEVFMMLADYLRSRVRLCGTKIVCAEGDCGACTVLIYRWGQKKCEFIPINACIASMAQLDLCFVLSVEAMKTAQGLSAVQKAMIKHGASQCGFCTPGFVMALSALRQKAGNLSLQQVKNALTGNLCRCTGYQSIIDAALSIDQSQLESLTDYWLKPELLKEFEYSSQQALIISANEQQFYAPLSLADAATYLSAHPDARLLSGSTDLGVAVNKAKHQHQRVLSLHLISELYELSDDKLRIMIGARVSLEELRHFCRKRVPDFARFINIFASPQIKNMATLIGNIANASPIGDTLPFLMVSDSLVHVCSGQGKRVIALENLFTGYKSLSLKPGEFISHISFALPSIEHHVRLEKVSQRRDLDIACINAAFSFRLIKNKINEPKIAFGGMGPKVVRLSQTEQFLNNQYLSHGLIEQAAQYLQQEINPLSDLRGSSNFRRKLADGLFKHFCQGLLEPGHA